jgi:hypothetical protein
MKAVQLLHFKQKLRFVIRQFACDHGLELLAGYKDHGIEHFNPKSPANDVGGKKQEKRTGISPAEHTAAIAEREALAELQQAPLNQRESECLRRRTTAATSGLWTIRSSYSMRVFIFFARKGSNI